jgi:hypothetical protein
MGLKNAVLVVTVAALATIGCQTLTEEAPSQPTNVAAPGIAPPVTLPAAAPAPSPSPVATPAPPPTLPPSAGSIDSIRVAFFGITCGKGNPVPNNGWKLLPKGCRGFVTATPKRRDNTDVPAAEHGPDIAWSVLYGDQFIRVEDPTFESDFNKDVIGEKVGGFGLCATVKGVTGCLAGQVVTSW